MNDAVTDFFLLLAVDDKMGTCSNCRYLTKAGFHPAIFKNLQL